MKELKQRLSAFSESIFCFLFVAILTGGAMLFAQNGFAKADIRNQTIQDHCEAVCITKYRGTVYINRTIYRCPEHEDE